MSATVVDLCGPWLLSLAEHPDDGCPAVPDHLRDFKPLEVDIPNSVQLALFQRGIIPDPYKDFNELEIKWIAHCSWSLSRSFHVSSDLLEASFAHLEIDGIDTVSCIKINGHIVGTTDNQYVKYTIKVYSSMLNHGINTIEILLSSPVKYCKTRDIAHMKARGYSVPYMEFPNGEKYWNQIRKVGCSFGWDWGPCIPTVGIDKPIQLAFFNYARVDEIRVHAILDEDGAATISAALVVSEYESKSVIARLIVVDDDTAEVVHQSTQQVNFQSDPARPEVKTDALQGSFKNPKLWWPLGYGPQNTYTVAVTLVAEDGTPLDSKLRRVGLRKMELITEDDPTDGGKTFFFRVNHVPIFIKGANYIPPDLFYHRITKHHIEAILESAVAANMNCIRVWGSAYEDDSFYDACDAKGLLVWQDFMFGCTLYPGDAAFCQSIKTEIIQQVNRLSGHPCLMMWCGNNEIEELIRHNWLKTTENKEKMFLDYTKLIYDIIVPAIRSGDSVTPFWPSSPSNGLDEWGDPKNEKKGDIHYWGVWHGGKSYDAYLETLKDAFSDHSEEMNLSSPEIEFRQRSPVQGNKAILEHIIKQFRLPKNFEHFVNVSQLLQALSIKAAVEHWRRCKPYTMGTIYWQLNDIWPGASWSSLEYQGRWKMLQYFAKHFFAPVIASVLVNNDDLEIHLSSDSTSVVDAELLIEAHSLSGTTVTSVSVDVTVAPLTSKCVHAFKPPKHSTKSLTQSNECVFYTFHLKNKADGVFLHQNFYFAQPLKALRLPHASLSCKVIDTATLEISSNNVALFVRLDLQLPRTDVVFSDNGFILFPNRPRTITLRSLVDQSLPSVEDLARCVSVTSLRDSY